MIVKFWSAHFNIRVILSYLIFFLVWIVFFLLLLNLVTSYCMQSNLDDALAESLGYVAFLYVVLPSVLAGR